MISRHSKREILFFLAIILFVLNACAGSLPSSNLKGATTYSHLMDLRTGKYRRSYRIHIPSGYDGRAQLPLVVVLHGAFDTAKGMEKFTGFSRLADLENFFVLYPEGIGILGFLQHWNAGHCCGKAVKDTIDDVGYLSSAITDVCKRLSVDQSRIYMVGFSNGGMMTYRFAAEHTGMLAAAVPMAASIGGRRDDEAPIWRIPKPENTLPIMIIHGVDDEDVPYHGGKSSRKKDERTYFSVEDSLQFWLDTNSCRFGPSLSHSASGAIEIQTWESCATATITVLCKINDWGHVWPGPAFTADLQETDPLYNFDVTDFIWDFIKQFRRIDKKIVR